MDSTFLERSAALRWALAVPFGGLGLLALAIAPAAGLLSLPIGLLLTGLAWWLVTGARDPPSPAVRWVVGVGGGLTVLEFAAFVLIGISNQ